MPNGVYECCAGPKNRRGSRPQPPASSAVQVGAVTHIQTTSAVSAGYRRRSSAASGRTAVESEAPPGQQQQYPSYHHYQQMPPSTGSIRVATGPEVNNHDQHHSHCVGDYAITVNTLRSPSLSLSSALSSPTSGADSDYDRERERERERRLPGLLGPRAAGGVGDGGNCYYMPSSPTTDSGSGSSPSVTPSPTILSTTARAYPSHRHPTTRDHTYPSISVPPLFNRRRVTKPSMHHAHYRSPSPTASPSVYQPTQTRDEYPFKQRLPSSNSITFNAGGGSGGGMASNYDLRTDTDSKAVAAFRPF